jgi:hypothetical protein
LAFERDELDQAEDVAREILRLAADWKEQQTKSVRGARQLGRDAFLISKTIFTKIGTGSTAARQP